MTTTMMPPPQQQQRPRLEKTRSTRSISLIGEWCPEEEGLDSSTRSSSSGSRRYSVEIPSSTHLLQQQRTYHRQASLPHPCNNNHNRRLVSSSTSSSARPINLRRPPISTAQHNNARQIQEPIFYSINTMLHRQEDECWDNSNMDSSDRSSNSRRRLLIRKDSQSSVKIYRHSNSSSRRLLSSTNNLSTSTSSSSTKNTSKSRRTKSVSFPQQQLITATHIIPRPSSTEIQRLYYTNDEILHMKRIYQHNVKKRVGKSIKVFGSKIKERLARNVDDDLSVECIVNAGEDLVSLSAAKSEEYYGTKRSSGSSTKMGGVIERASCTLPSMITLLL